MTTSIDCLIIGGGPAGLTAATYLARFYRRVTVVDSGESRAAQIPESHNQPGIAAISGSALLKAMRSQAVRYGARLVRGLASDLQRTGHGFVARIGDNAINVPTVLLATGLTDTAPDLPGLAQGTARAVVRYCPICDGFEATDRNVAVYGAGEHAISKALFLRTFTRNLTILPLDEGTHADGRLSSAGIAVLPSPPASFWQTASGIGAMLKNGQRVEFDVLYPALGCEVHSSLAADLGAKCNAAGCLEVDDKLQTTVPGLYGAGDVVSDLHQISVAEGHAAIAATAIHNSLPRNFR